MPNFRYRALTEAGEVVSGSISAPNIKEVDHRIEYLGLMPIEATVENAAGASTGISFSAFSRPRAEDVTTFTRDLALLMKAGARLDAALEMLSGDEDVGRLRPVVTKIRAGVLGGESFADALAEHPSIFPAMYVAIVRVGEASGTLDHILTALARERSRAELQRQRVIDAVRYPLFILCAAGAVLLFFLLFVLPQFAGVLRDFGAKLDPIVEVFLAVSDALRHHGDVVATVGVAIVAAIWLVARRPALRQSITRVLTSRGPLRSIVQFHVTALFCRNLGALLGSGMTLSAALRIINDIMDRSGLPGHWQRLQGSVRQGSKLSEALVEVNSLPSMAMRMIKMGEETGDLPTLLERIAEFYESKLQRSLDRIVAIVGPGAIIIISVVVGGLVVSVMTSLLSVSQIVG